jgi:hypothetical protein
VNIAFPEFEPKFRNRQLRNRFTTRNQWFTETIETIRSSGLTLIISTIRFFKTFTAEFGLSICARSVVVNLFINSPIGLPHYITI